MVGCTECPDPSPGAKVSACTKCGQVDDLLHQVTMVQETVKRLCSISRTEIEIKSWFQNHASVADH